jgi:hypothetical protein
MYRPAPTAQEAQAVGLTLEEASGPPIEVWPDTQNSVLVFDALGSQWIYAGMGGVPTGLVYASIEPVLRVMAISAEDWRQVFDDIRVMEDAALREMHRQRQKK